MNKASDEGQSREDGYRKAENLYATPPSAWPSSFGEVAGDRQRDERGAHRSARDRHFKRRQEGCPPSSTATMTIRKGSCGPVGRSTIGNQ